MSESQIVVGKAAEYASRRTVESIRVWKMIAPVALAFLLIGLVDIGLSWYPVRFGIQEWEFGTIGTTLNNLPLPTLGLLLLAGWAAVTERVIPVRILAVVAVVVGLVLAGLVVIYLLTLPPAWNAVRGIEDETARLIARKGIAKTLVQALLYPVVYLVVGWRAWKLQQS